MLQKLTATYLVKSEIFAREEMDHLQGGVLGECDLTHIHNADRKKEKGWLILSSTKNADGLSFIQKSLLIFSSISNVNKYIYFEKYESNLTDLFA